MKTLFRLLGCLLFVLAGNTWAGVPVNGYLTVSPWSPPFPGEMVFGAQHVGTTSAPLGTTLTASIVGGGGLHQVQITSIGITPGGEFTKGTGCDVGTSLPHNGNCSFNTTFSPSAPGNRSAVLNVTCQVIGGATIVSILCDGNPQTAINLSGTGLVLSSIPSMGQTGVTLLALALLGFALLRLRRS